MTETNLIMKLGVDWTRVLSYKQADGQPVNLTGYTARMQVRSHPSSNIAILDLTTQNGGIAIDGPTGVITLTVTHAQLTEGPTGLHLGTITAPPTLLSEDLDNGIKYSGTGKIALYDLDLISPGGIITKLLTGKVCFDPSVTR